mmetsp:Transcript_2989/g.5209  ORF Transcript_2989/g.5209 Transcript_2989/m.5209 type:complete len:235 (+) Transcript_2989:55-759(+)
MSCAGEIAYDHAAMVQKIFDKLDKEGLGTVKSECLGDALRLAGTNPTEKEVAKLLDQHGRPQNLDVAALGRIVEAALSEWLSKDQASELLESLRRFDPGGSGKLSRSELLRVMQMGGNSFGEKEVEEMLAHVTVDSDGCFDYAELVTTYFFSPESGVAGAVQARPRAKSDYPLARFRRAVRKLMIMRMVAFSSHSSSFTAANAVGVVEANLAIDDEFEQVMKRMNRGRTTVIRD